MGEMADMYDYCFTDEYEYGYDEGNAPREVYCKYCGAKDLQWFHTTDTGWMIYEMTGEVHKCKRPKVGKRK